MYCLESVVIIFEIILMKNREQFTFGYHFQDLYIIIKVFRSSVEPFSGLKYTGSIEQIPND